MKTSSCMGLTATRFLVSRCATAVVGLARSYQPGINPIAPPLILYLLLWVLLSQRTLTTTAAIHFVVFVLPLFSTKPVKNIALSAVKKGSPPASQGQQNITCSVLSFFILLLYSKEHFSSKTVRIAKGPLGSLSQDLSNFTVTLLLNPMEQRMGTKTLRSSHMVWILLPRGPQWEEQYLISSYHTQRSQSMGDTGKTKPGDQPPDARSPHTPYVRAHNRAVSSSTR